MDNLSSVDQPYKILVAIQTIISPDSPFAKAGAYNANYPDSELMKNLAAFNQKMIIGRAKASEARFDRVFNVSPKRSGIEGISATICKAIADSGKKNIKIVFFGEGVFLGEKLLQDEAQKLAEIMELPVSVLQEGFFSKYTPNELSQICVNILQQTNSQKLAITLKSCNTAMIDESRQDKVAQAYKAKMQESQTEGAYKSFSSEVTAIPEDDNLISLTERVGKALARSKLQSGSACEVTVKGYPSSFITRPDIGRIIYHKPPHLSQEKEGMMDHLASEYLEFFQESIAYDFPKEETKKIDSGLKAKEIKLLNSGVVTKGTFKF